MERLTPEEIQRFREISIHHILGIDNTGRNISMSCPLPGHRDRNPSFLLRPDNSYICFGRCNVKGKGAIDFAEHMWHKTNFEDKLLALVPYLH